MPEIVILESPASLLHSNNVLVESEANGLPFIFIVVLVKVAPKLLVFVAVAILSNVVVIVPILIVCDVVVASAVLVKVVVVKDQG